MLKTIFSLLAISICLFSVLVLPVIADDEVPELNQAQILIFMGDHLKNVSPGHTLTYSFSSRAQDQAEIKDNIRMRVTGVAQDGGRDLDFEFLSGNRRLPFPPARGYNGNPITVQFLERDVQDMAKATGGSRTYIRNRVRNAFMNPQMRDTKISYDGKEIDGVEITVKPFTNDPRAQAELSEFVNKHYRFVYSEDIPGGLFSIHITVPGNAAPKLQEELTFRSLDLTNSS